MTCRSIQRFCGAHHTPGLGTLVANLVVSKIDVRDGPVYFQCLGQGLEAATDQGWRLVWGPFGQNLISEMLKRKDIQLRHVESLRFKTWKNNPEINSFILHLHTVYDIQLDWEYLTTQLDPRLTMKLQPLQSIQTCHCQRMSKTWQHDSMTCRSIQRFCGASHTPGLGALVANLAQMQIDVSDGLVDFKCLGQGLEAATDQGWRLARGPFGQNLISEMLKRKDIQLRHVESLRFKTWKNNPEIHGFIQHLHTVWHTAGLGVFDNSTRSEMNDETAAPPKHPNLSLSEDVKNMTAWQHDMPQHSAILRSQPHTRPWRPQRQSG